MGTTFHQMHELTLQKSSWKKADEVAVHAWQVHKLMLICCCLCRIPAHATPKRGRGCRCMH